jgi:hypothetical protein
VSIIQVKIRTTCYLSASPKWALKAHEVNLVVLREQVTGRHGQPGLPAPAGPGDGNETMPADEG